MDKTFTISEEQLDILIELLDTIITNKDDRYEMCLELIEILSKQTEIINN